jgi:hypothetical protein
MVGTIDVFGGVKAPTWAEEAINARVRDLVTSMVEIGGCELCDMWNMPEPTSRGLRSILGKTTAKSLSYQTDWPGARHTFLFAHPPYVA